jgi:hypothetical protein
MATISKLNALQAALLSGTAFAGFMIVEGLLAPPVQAQVHLPQTGTLSNAQPIFCVNPTTLAVEDCVANVTVGNISVGNVSVSNIANGNLTSAGNVTEANSAAILAATQGATPAGSNIIGKVGIDQTTVGTTNGVSLAQIANVTVLAGAGASGTGAQRVTVSQDTTTIAGSAPGTAGTASANVVTVQGVASMTPILDNNTPQGQFNYPNRANWVGNTTTVANTTAATIIPAPGAGLSNFVEDYNCSNTSATNVTVTFNDNPATVEIVPATGGFVLDLTEAREVAGNTALTMTLSANATSVSCTASGYKATT